MTETDAAGDSAGPDAHAGLGDGLRFILNHGPWQRFRFGCLRGRVLEELAGSQRIWPADGSALQGDDSYLSPFGTSLLAMIVNRLCSSLDQLQLITWSVEKTGTAMIFAHFTLLRSALTGAATAHWLVSGSEVERRLRALRLVFYDLKQELAFGRGYVDTPALGQPEAAAALRQANELVASAPKRLRAIHTEYCQLMLDDDATCTPPTFKEFDRMAFRETEIVTAASEKMHQEGVHSHAFEVLHQYRLTSGFVHNLDWATRTGSRVKTTPGEDRARREVRGSADNIYNGAMSALLIVRSAKRRALELAAAPAGSIEA